MSNKLTTELFLERVKNANLEMYLKCDYTNTIYVTINKKVLVTCRDHGPFEVWPGDHMKGMSGCIQCILEKRKKTMIKKYGVDNFFKRKDLVDSAMLKKHGVKNPGLMDDHISKMIKTNKEKYGIEWSSQHPDVVESRISTNLNKYGAKNPSQNKEVASKIALTKMLTGGFSKSNSSKEATEFILEYLKYKEYSIDQCAFSYPEYNLHEWGLFYKGRWRLFDLVVFESGKRGQKQHIIEILEYHGPFHYTDNDVVKNGDQKAYPWKSNKTTIKESVEVDKLKKELASTLTNNFNVIWKKDLDPSNSLNENILNIKTRDKEIYEFTNQS